jgi:uncharacterized protein (TIGR04255 family)
MSVNTLPSYKKPPVIEVVLGITFETLSSVKLPHIGIFWDTIRSEFPKCQQAPPLGNIDAVIERESGVPLPRVWLINRNDDNLIQLQKNKFLFNWRKRQGDYPRFGAVSSRFFMYLDRFKTFLSENELGSIAPTECELTYINHIIKGTRWEQPEDAGSILPDVQWRQNKNRFLSNPIGINWSAVFMMPEDAGSLFVKLNYGTRMPDNMPLFILELTVKGFPKNADKVNIKEWYGTAREWIVRGFEDLTSDKVQRENWEKV